MEKITLALIAIALFGRLLPVLCIVLIVGGLALLIKTAVEEGKQL